MPKSPLESFFDKMLDNLEDAAEDFIRDVNKQAKENIRRIGRVNTSAPGRGMDRPARQPSSRPHKRVPGGHEPKARPKVTPPQLTMYDVLETSVRASSETISAAYKSLARKFHPDSGMKDPSKMREINAAYEILKDPKRRRIYDKSIGL